MNKNRLVYRGIEYQEPVSLLTLTTASDDKELIYRGNSPQPRINLRFSWFPYIKQLFSKSEAKPILDPISFWYNRQREFIQDCWNLDDEVEKLNRSWSLTQKIELATALKAKPKTKLKYRGVTYYH